MYQTWRKQLKSLAVKLSPLDLTDPHEQKIGNENKRRSI
jgi:hypothetical protein